MATDRAILKEAQAAMLGSTPAVSPIAAVNSAHERPVTYSWSDGGTAGTVAAESAIYYARNKCLVKAFVVTTPVAVTAGDTNYKIFTLAKRTAGGSPTTVCTMNTSISVAGFTGDIVALAPVSGTLVAAAVQLAAGDSLTLAVTKAASGLAVAAATSFVSFEVVVEEN